MKKHKKLAGFASLVLAACMLLTSCSGGASTSSAAGSKTGSAASASSQSGSSVKDNAGGTASEGEKMIKATNAAKLPASASARKDTLVVGTAQLSGKFNQLWAESADDFHVSVPCTGMALMDNDDEGNLIDGTASMSVSDDGLTYTFKLKYDDKYSDGSPVKAEDYVNYFKVLCDKSYDGPSDTPANYGLVGAKAYHDGTAKDISGIKVVDDKTIQFKFEKPNSSAQYVVGSAYPISTALYGKLIKQGDLSAYKKLSMINYVSNGQYILTEYKAGQYAKMKSNPKFCLGAPKIKNIIVKVVAQGAEMQAVTTGEVDIDDEVTCNDDQITIGQNAKFVNMWIQPTLGYGWIGLNHKNTLFQDKKVRQALLYAIDRKTLVNSVYGNYAHVQNVNQTAQNWLYTTEGINTYDYDLDKAAQLLKEAGWTKDSSGKLMKDGKQFKFTFTASKGNAVTDVLIPMMIDSYKKLGIDMQAEYVDWPTLQNKFTKLTYDMSFMAWGLTPDPNDSYIYSTGGAENYLGYSNPDVDKAYQTALGSVGKENIKKAYQKVYQMINDDLPNFIVYQRSDLVAFNTRIQDFHCSPYCPIYQQYYKYNLQ
ncbi:MAG: ABC transporter substrate-binding protein [Oscillospiraceae bacterium]|jgi:peptide/nickel transport system substrate-binding protein|nr:ABC transporter substrate-binding protein [Oscillospiraceae bacterium]